MGGPFLVSQHGGRAQSPPSTKSISSRMKGTLLVALFIVRCAAVSLPPLHAGITGFSCLNQQNLHLDSL